MSAYLEKMAEFSALLRREGLSAGPQETADACEILSCLDLRQRGTVRTALQAVYAKSREEQAAFQRAFDGFFVSVEKRELLRRRHEDEAREFARRRDEAAQELQVGGRPMDLREDLQETYIRMSEEKREQLRRMLEKAKGNLERSPKLYGNFIRSVFMRFLLEQQMVMEDAAVGCEEADPDMALLYRDISQFKDADIPRAAALIAAVSRQLDAELSRQRRGGGHRGAAVRRVGLHAAIFGVRPALYQVHVGAVRGVPDVPFFRGGPAGGRLCPAKYGRIPGVCALLRALRPGDGPGLRPGGPVPPPSRPPGAFHDAADPIGHQDHRPAPGGPGGAGGEAAGGEGPLAQPHPRAEVGLCQEHPDHGLPVPDGPVQHPGRAGPGLWPDAEIEGRLQMKFRFPVVYRSRIVW